MLVTDNLTLILLIENLIMEMPFLSNIHSHYRICWCWRDCHQVMIHLVPSFFWGWFI